MRLISLILFILEFKSCPVHDLLNSKTNDNIILFFIREWSQNSLYQVINVLYILVFIRNSITKIS